MTVLWAYLSALMVSAETARLSKELGQNSTGEAHALRSTPPRCRLFVDYGDDFGAER